MKILIVDDNKENRILLDALLRGHGFETAIAENGKDALQELKEKSIDLVISDILMPVMDGFQLCWTIKSDEELRLIPIIIYTATYTGPQDEAFAMKIGADRFILKPCDPEIFIKVVRDVMEADRQQDGTVKPLPAGEEEVLKLYNERLVRKLEQKMLRAEFEIKKRQEAEEALKESEEKLRRITASAQDAIIMIDDQGKVSFWNEAAERIFGYSGPEIMKKDLHAVLASQQNYEAYHKNYPRFKETGQGPFLDKISELTGKKKDGTEFPIELSLSGVEIRGKWHGIGIVRDITYRKRIEAEQKAMEKKIQQNQRIEAIGTLAGGIAHDFNNLLSAIIGFTELSLDTVEKGSVMDDNLNEVHIAANRAKELVKQILTVSRQSDEAVKPTRIDIIAEEVLKLIRSSIPATIEIRQNIESDSLIMGNASRVHQILMNLCTNAAYAMEKEGGVLKVGLKDVTIQDAGPLSDFELKPGEYVELTVSDTGAGIPPEVMGSIFEPYFTTKPPGEGTGMGLALVHGIVKSYGGKIAVESELEKGTVFTIHLPITQKCNEVSPYISEELPSGRERILFVDDETSIVRMSSKILEKLGYSVTIKTSSKEALELFRVKPDEFDLVITDMNMPHITGDALSAELMKIRPDIPVILCTGYSKKISDQVVREVGIKALVYKPVVRSDLAKTVRKILDEARVFAQSNLK